jgi:Arm domain-containing DNA-binding protein/integrase-like protein
VTIADTLPQASSEEKPTHKPALTDERIKALIRSAKAEGSRIEVSDYSLNDSHTPGLRLRIAPDGAAEWYLLYRRASDNQKRRVKIIGLHGERGYGERDHQLTLRKARGAARKLKARISEGADPAAEKRATREMAKIAKAAGDDLPTLNDAVWLWHLQQLADLKAKRPNATAKQIAKSWGVKGLALYERHVMPKLGDRKLPSLLTADVETVLIEAERATSKTTRNRLLTVLSASLNMAVKADAKDHGKGVSRITAVKVVPHPGLRRSALMADDGGNLRAARFGITMAVTDYIDRYDETEFRRRDKHVHPDDIGAFWRAAEKIQDATVRDVIKLTICTGQRISQLTDLQWPSVIFDHDASTGYIEWDVGSMKAGRLHVVGISMMAWQIVYDRWIATRRPRTGYVFPDSFDPSHPISYHVVEREHKAIAAAVSPKATLHGWRTAISDRILRAKLNPVYRKWVLSHGAQDADTTGSHYTTAHAFIEPTREALEAWQSFLLRAATAPEQKIVQLRSEPTTSEPDSAAS